MTLHCERCCVLIEHDNRRWPGFCSDKCRTIAQRDRLTEQRRRRLRRALFTAQHSGQHAEAERIARKLNGPSDAA